MISFKDPFAISSVKIGSIIRFNRLNAFEKYEAVLSRFHQPSSRYKWVKGFTWNNFHQSDEFWKIGESLQRWRSPGDLIFHIHFQHGKIKCIFKKPLSWKFYRHFWFFSLIILISDSFSKSFSTEPLFI